MEECAGIPPRRSAPVHPQIQPTEDSAGATCRRNPCLRPQFQANEDDAGVTSPAPAPVASLPDDDDMLREILLRLPPQPSSFPRASAVCKRWRGLVTDPRFLNRFRAHHQKPPLLGFFERSNQGILFHPILKSPDRIPPARFSLGCCSSNREYDLLNCRHGLILLKYCVTWEVVVCDPITGEQCRVAVPPEFKMDYFTGAVLCAAGNQEGHVHGGCHSSPFKVVLVSMYREDNQQLARVYSSETRECGSM